MTISPEEHFQEKLQKVLKIDLDYRLNKTLSNDLFEFCNRPNKEVRFFTTEFKRSKIDRNRNRNMNFEKNYTEFLNKHFLLTEGILVAGGSLVSFLYYPYRKERELIHPFFEDEKQDVDIFFYGLSTEQIKEKINDSISFLKIKFTIISLFANENVVSVTFKNRQGHNIPLQFVLRGYTSVSHILHSFDLGCCSIGYDVATKKFYTTSLGKFCLTFRCNIKDSTRSFCTSYEPRLQKYFNRGFSIIDIDEKQDITEEERTKLFDIACMMYYSSTVEGEKIELDKIQFSGLSNTTIKGKIMGYIIDAFLEEYIQPKTVKSREVGASFKKKEITVESTCKKDDDKSIKKILESDSDEDDCKIPVEKEEVESSDSDFEPKRFMPCKKVADSVGKSTVFKM